MKGKNNEDYYFTARLGVLFMLILLVFVFLGDIAQDEPQIVSPIYEAQAQEPTPTPTPTPILSKKEMVIKEIEDVFGEQAELAKKVAFCESSLIPQKQSKVSSAKGLFQIIDGTWRQFKCSGEALNYVDNIKCAKKIYDYYGSFGTSGGWLASKGCWNN
jgi:hypothetical protein